MLCPKQKQSFRRVSNKAYLDVQLVLSERQGLACSHSQLPLRQVLPCDGFCHRVLHLSWHTLLAREVKGICVTLIEGSTQG